MHPYAHALRTVKVWRRVGAVGSSESLISLLVLYMLFGLLFGFVRRLSSQNQ